jgi:hypothetical protein
MCGYIIEMMDLATILGIASIKLTGILASHISLSSSCWGLTFHTQTRGGVLEVDVDYQGEELRASVDSKGEVKMDIVDISGNSQ